MPMPMFVASRPTQSIHVSAVVRWSGVDDQRKHHLKAGIERLPSYRRRVGGQLTVCGELEEVHTKYHAWPGHVCLIKPPRI